MRRAIIVPGLVSLAALALASGPALACTGGANDPFQCIGNNQAINGFSNFFLTNLQPVPGAPSQILDFGGELGGPIIKDRLWFWGSGNRNQVIYDFGAIEEIEVRSGGADTSQLTGGIGINIVSARGANLVNYGGKLSGQVTAENEANIFFDFGDKQKIGRVSDIPQTTWDQRPGPVLLLPNFPMDPNQPTTPGQFQLNPDGALFVNSLPGAPISMAPSAPLSPPSAEAVRDDAARAAFFRELDVAITKDRVLQGSGAKSTLEQSEKGLKESLDKLNDAERALNRPVLIGGLETPIGGQAFDTSLITSFTGGLGGAGAQTAAIDVYLFDNAGGRPMQSPTGREVCSPCTLSPDASGKKARIGIDRLIGSAGGLGAVKTGYAVLVVQSGNADAVGLTDFVVNSHGSALDLAVFGFEPQPIGGATN
ncbi:MAG: hypothetical protein HZC25_14975 [Rhodospirillales bacterium]|nr:hypothetical protein [Rhodospirillales bacterium]